MTREMMPLRDAIGRIISKHEAERKRLDAWANEVAPKLAAKLDIPLEQLRPVLDAQITLHLAVIGEMAKQDAAELVMATESSSRPAG